jgi:hypothetical protein
MTVLDYIKTFDAEYPNTYNPEVKLKWINTVESNVYDDIIKDFSTVYYSRVLNEYQYDLPSGVEFMDVEPLMYVNGVRYRKKDARAYKEHRSFWYDGSKINIYPACTATDTEYESDEGEISFATSTIVTTGDDFTFRAGDVVKITGCTVNTDNNKTATILSADTDTLTFADDTFIEGEETAAITIQKATIRLVYKDRIAEKEIGDISTDELIIPAKFRDIYDYYLMYKIAYLDKEYQEAPNHMTLYTSRLRDYEMWYEDHRPARPESEIIAPEEGETYTEDGFDYC